jgi:hypothetical protein
MVPEIRLVTLSRSSPANKSSNFRANGEFAKEIRFMGNTCPEQKDECELELPPIPCKCEVEPPPCRCECDVEPPPCGCECDGYVCNCECVHEGSDCPPFECVCESVCICESDPHCDPDPDCDCDSCHCDCVTERPSGNEKQQQTKQGRGEFRTFFKIAGDKDKK